MAFFNFFKKKNKDNDENIQNTEVNNENISEEDTEENSVDRDNGIRKNEKEETEEKGEYKENGNIKETEEKNNDEEETASVEATDEESAADSAEEEKKSKPGFFAKIKQGLAKTRQSIVSGVENVLKSFTKIDEELFEELEESLIMADIGVDTSLEIINRLRERVKKEKVTEVSEIKGLIVEIITEMLTENEHELELPSPSVILVIGVNGVGKTTTIGKLANHYKNEGNSVLLAAADTFRAAAIDQLQIWGERNGVDVIRHQENSDPGAVVYDAVQAAKARKTDILICDTAGRLHNKKNLMDELKKIFKIINRDFPEARLEVFLVLDATTGQNALIQAKQFGEAADITGLVLTKLDGTAKGGVVIAIKNELDLPVRFIGVGEGIDDLRQFRAEEFAKALFDMS